MKRLLIFIFIISIAYSLRGQNYIDVLRYSQTTYGGTARATAMGGAFGALGGDFSSISYNPGGIAVYRTNELTITPALMFSETEASFYKSGKSTDNVYNLNLNNIGVAASYKSNNEDGWVNVNFAVGYNKLANFNRNYSYTGINSTSSITDYWAIRGTETIEEKWSDALNAAYDSYLINDEVTDQGLEYFSTIDANWDSNSLQQSENVSTEGSMGEYIFAFGGNYMHKLYVGMSLGIGVLRYEEHNRVKEVDINNRLYNFHSLEYDEDLKATGTSFNAKFGAIYRPNEWLRVGAAIHTPTFWSIERDSKVEIFSAFDEIPTTDGSLSYEIFTPERQTDYELTTPFKAIGSLGFVFQKQGLISIDYEFTDYSSARLRSGDYSYENDEINDKLTVAHNFRLGAEYKIGVFSLRGGYGFYGSPFENTSKIKDAVRHTVSGGVGFNSGSFFMDFAFVKTLQEETVAMYEIIDSTVKSNADLMNNTNRMLLTFGFRF